MGAVRQTRRQLGNLRLLEPRCPAYKPGRRQQLPLRVTVDLGGLGAAGKLALRRSERACGHTLQLLQKQRSL